MDDTYSGLNQTVINPQQQQQLTDRSQVGSSTLGPLIRMIPAYTSIWTNEWLFACRRLFSACDVNKSGQIEYEDFTVVCRELNVPEPEIKSLFDKFDPDEDGYIDYSKFSSRFREVSQTLDLASFGNGSSQNQRLPWEEFVGGIDENCLLSESLRDQLGDLYQAIHSSANMTLLQQYEEIIHSLINQSLDNRLECEQLETSLKRAEEMNNSQLTELEEDIQQQLARTEERVRDEERKKMEVMLATVQRKHENKVTDLHATLDRLLKNQNGLLTSTSQRRRWSS
ncbi:Ras and EF-hand domain-containing protein [Larimichthys crocea]|uniref:Uncharacterized protein n=1 Tax=Larimichthys crocea TaxID=215358 RepID=A0ACD3QFB5_LARCR|nr:Ras and EF-hand domain-containing protein [Larimichthys crocea]